MTLLDPDVHQGAAAVDEEALIREARRLRRRRWMFGSALVALAVGAATAGFITASSPPASRLIGSARSSSPGVGRRSLSTSGTFVSLLRVCRLSPPRDRLLMGCVDGHYDLALEQFSLRSGQRIRTVSSVPFNADTPAVLTPAGTAEGTILLTSASGPRCLRDGRPLKGVYMECQPSENSCINKVMSLGPSDPTPRYLLTISSDLSIGAVVPNPAGSEIAYSARPCVGTHPLPGLYMRNLRTGATREITKASYCSSIGQPTWNATGTEVAFRFRASSSPPQPAPIGSSGPGCLNAASPSWHLVITPTATRATSTALQPGGHNCSIDAAAFDRTGILLAEGCTNHNQQLSFDGATRGPAYLLQYNQHGRLTARIPLPHRGLDPEQTMLAAEPNSATVLITQDQPNGLVARNDDHVYELTGTHLREVIENSWGADFMAAPW